jgi:DNA-binding transcriptional ArsR family regulator
MIRRAQRKPTSFTIISNDIINDQDLNLAQIGLLIYLISKPDNWKVSTNHLANHFGNDRGTILKHLKSLRNAGYIESSKSSTGYTDYIVYESKQSEPEPKKTLLGDDAHEPKVEKPKMEKPKMAISPIVNTDNSISTDIYAHEPDFLLFWKNYPRLKDKVRAEKAFKKLTFAEKQLAIKDCIDRYAGVEEQFIPYPSTYLNNKYFNDKRDTKNETHRRGNKPATGADIFAEDLEEYINSQR